LEVTKKTNIFLKIVNFPLVQIIIAIIFVNVPTFVLRNIAQGILFLLSITNEFIVTLVIFFVRVLTLYFAYFLFVKYIDKREPDEIQVNLIGLKEFAFGLLLGVFTICIVLGLLMLLGNYSILGINGSAPIFQSILVHFFYAFLQDIVYFAIIFRIVENKLGSWFAIIIAAFIFGFKHLFFPGYNLWSVIAQSLEAGILFSSLYILTRKIWIIFGFHFVWNFIQYGIVGFPKFQGIQGLLDSKFIGSDIITGNPIGLEASLFTFVIGFGLGLYFLNKVHNKGDFILPYWKRLSKN